MNKAIIFPLFFLCVLMPLAAGGETATQEAVSSSELYQLDFEEIKRRYGDGPVAIRGIAVEVGPDIFGLPSVTLSDSPEGTPHVLCVLPYSDYFKLGDIEEGKQVTMSGSPRGKTDEGVLVVKQSVVVSKD